MAVVDIIVPCYNYARFLRDAVGSVLSRQGVDVRVLILDDASTDETPEVGRALAADPRVEYRRHAVNRGHIATYNEGIDWLTGEFCFLLSADDMVTEGSLARAVRLFEERPDVGLVCGQAIWTDRPQDHPCPPPADYTTTVVPGVEFIRSICQSGLNPVESPTAITRAGLQKKLGGYLANLPHAGDMEMWMRLAAYSSIGIVNTNQAYYRRHQQNMSVPYAHERGVRDFEQRVEVFRTLFQDHGDRIEPGGRLLETAIGVLSREAFSHAVDAHYHGEPKLCRRFLALAATLDPELSRSAAFRKVATRARIQQCVGTTVWSLSRSAVGAVRRLARA
jgi:glycosyltransferase involved in cell wall biosynthesis